jgi:hypothetical protein
MAINEWEQWGGSSFDDDLRPYGRFGSGYPYERFGSSSAYGRFGSRSPYERYGRFGSGYPYERFGSGSPYGQYRFERYPFERGEFGRGEHTWRGGVLGWLGAGIRAGAGWFGDRLQQWGTWFGGRVSGGTEEIGRAVRGRGEQMASALEEQDERTGGNLRARSDRPQRYRRPDERILDDVWHRISVAAVDAEDVEVAVNNGVVTLSGRVSTRFEKRIIEDIAESVFGVQEVHNHLRLARVGSEARDVAQGNAAVPSAQKNFENAVNQAERH